MVNPFTWVRRQFAEATVLGIADGLKIAAAQIEESKKKDDDADDLRAVLDGQLKMLPEHVESGEKKSKK